MSRRPLPVIAEEEAEPLAVDKDDGDEDADDIPEIDADVDDDVAPVIVHD